MAYCFFAAYLLAFHLAWLALHLGDVYWIYYAPSISFFDGIDKTGKRGVSKKLETKLNCSVLSRIGNKESGKSRSCTLNFCAFLLTQITSGEIARKFPCLRDQPYCPSYSRHLLIFVAFKLVFLIVCLTRTLTSYTMAFSTNASGGLIPATLDDEL